MSNRFIWSLCVLIVHPCDFYLLSSAAAISETIVTMLPSSPHVQKVYATEDGGIIPALQSLTHEDLTSTLCIDSTTLDVEVARSVAKEVNNAGATMVDAPVSGGVAGAKAGTLSFLVGGTEPAFERVSPILSRMGKRIMHCGPSGAGLAAKICNNMLLGVQQIAVAEAMLLGQKLGLEPVVLADVINNSTGACWSSSVNNPVPGALPDKEPPCARDFEGGFATSLMLKVSRSASRFASTITSSAYRIWAWQPRLLTLPVVLSQWARQQRGSTQR